MVKTFKSVFLKTLCTIVPFSFSLLTTAQTITPDSNSIIYVKPTASGNGTGISWADATDSLHNAIHAAGVQKVFVAVGTYKVGAYSFIMRNGVEIYGGFVPDSGIVDLSSARILPKPNDTIGSILNGESVRPVIYNVFTDSTAIDSTAILNGFTLTGGKGITGGGIYNSYASPTLSNLLIKENQANNDGGGMYNINSSSPIMTNVTVANNTANYGGGIFNRNNASPVMNNVTIKANTTVYDGGGIYNDASSSPSLTNVVIKGNRARSGGAIYSRANSSPTLVNVLMVNNTATTNGGAIRNETSSSPSLTNVTIVNNTGSNTLYATDGSTSLANSIVYGSISENYTARHSLVQSNTDFTNGNLDATGITINDVFTDTATGDYTLKNGSVAVNTGNNALFSGLDSNTKDPTGNPRVHNYATGGVIDMGAYESVYELTLHHDVNGIIYVTTTGTGNGSNWANATNDLHNAIHAAGVQKVFVATGNYNTGTHSFAMKNNVAIYGGFDPADGIDDLSDARMLHTQDTATGSVLNGQNTRPVIWNVFTDSTAMDTTAVLDGFTIINGNYGDDGGGVRNIYASPTLRNLVIKDNTARFGAGIFNRNSSPVMTNIAIRGNIASTDGGGMYNDASSNPTINRVSITGNKANFAGGIMNRNSSPTLTNVLIAANTSNNTGGGMYNQNGAAPVLTNTTIAGNTPDAFHVNNASVSLLNTIVFGSVSGNTITSQYSIIEGRTDTANGNLDATSITINDVFTDTATGDYTLKNGSIAAVNTGSNVLFTGLDSNTKDLAGNPRLDGIDIDLGAYEFQGSPLPVKLVYFTAQKHGKTALLQWETAGEQNNRGFEIERSADGKEWSKIGYQSSLAENGNSALRLNYTYTENTPLTGSNFYRLKQTDFDGKYEYSAVRIVTFDIATDIKVYPNPSSETITISGLSGNEIIIIYDVSGRIVKQSRSVNTQVRIMLDDMNVGIYNVQIISDNAVIASPKLVITR